jgi:hypothetical protein
MAIHDWDYDWMFYSVPLDYVSVFKPISHFFIVIAMALCYSLKSDIIILASLLFFQDACSGFFALPHDFHIYSLKK